MCQPYIESATTLSDNTKSVLVNDIGDVGMAKASL